MQAIERNGVGRGMVNGRGVLVLAVAMALIGCECDPGTVSREAKLELASSGLQFGVVSVGQKAVRTVGLRNSGSAPAVVSALQVAAPFGVDGETSFELGSGETRELELYYAPTEPNATAEENHIGELVIVHDTEQGPVNLSLVGHAIEPEVRVTPAELAFGEVDVGNSKSLQITVENNGTDKFDVSAVKIEPAGAFTVDATKLKGTYQPGAKTTTDVTFTPAAGEPVSASLVIETTAPAMPTLTVPLSGTGLAPKVTLCYSIEGGTQECLNADKTSGTLDFGALDEGTSKKATFTLRNDGNTQVQLVGLMAGNAMAADITGNPCLAANPAPDFVFTPNRFGQKLPEDPTESEPNPPNTQTLELVYTPTHTEGCYEDTNDRARLAVKLGTGSKSPVYQVDIQGASKVGRIRFTEVTYVDLPSAIDLDYNLFNDGAGSLTVDSLELVEGYTGAPTQHDCLANCATRRPCSDPAVSGNGECQAFSFIGTPKTSFAVPSGGGSARVTDGAKDLRYTPPDAKGTKVVACMRVKSNDPVYPTICARLEGVR